MRVSSVIAALLLSPLMASAAKVSTDFNFATNVAHANKRHTHKGKALRRHRRTKTESGVNVKQLAKEAGRGGAALSTEDKTFWNRLLQEEMSIPSTPRPTPAPVVPAPVVPATPAPTPCPVIIEVDCVMVDGSMQCVDIEPPASGTGADCIVEVEYSYTFTNVGSEIERIYSLEITRGGETVDITDTFPITDIAPNGGQAFIVQNVEVDICQASGDSIWAIEAAFVTGPPCDVEVTIACESENGDECRSLPQADSPDECLIDITYTYTVTNIGDVDANIILFTRTRNGEFQDLIGLLPDTALSVDEMTNVQETEEIDRCVQQSFATNTIVAQIPNADLLCEDVGFYP